MEKSYSWVKLPTPEFTISKFWNYTALEEVNRTDVQLGLKSSHDWLLEQYSLARLF